MSEDTNYDITPEEEVVKKRKGKISRMRNLAQFRNLSDDDFEKAMEKKVLGVESSAAFEKRIDAKWAEFEQDYDLSDLKINDRDSLRALIQAQINLEDYEQYLFKFRAEGLSGNTILEIKEIQKAMSDLRADISKIQNDLMITRKVRKSDRDASVLAYMEDLKDKAKRFYESKMSYIFCEKCNLLLATIWTMYPEEERNKIALICHRDMGDGTKCGHKNIVDTKQLLKNRGTSNVEITPESMR